MIKIRNALREKTKRKCFEVLALNTCSLKHKTKEKKIYFVKTITTHFACVKFTVCKAHLNMSEEGTKKTRIRVHV